MLHVYKSVCEYEKRDANPTSLSSANAFFIIFYTYF